MLLIGFQPIMTQSHGDYVTSELKPFSEKYLYNFVYLHPSIDLFVVVVSYLQLDENWNQGVFPKQPNQRICCLSMCVARVLTFESVPVWLTCLFSCHDKSYPKRSRDPVVKADKMLCHDTVIPQPAAAHHDKQGAPSIVSNMILPLSLRDRVVFVLIQRNDTV